MPAHNERSQVSTFIPTLLKKLKPFSSILLQKNTKSFSQTILNFRIDLKVRLNIPGMNRRLACTKLSTTYASNRIFFKATVCPVSISFALQTTPYVPSPIFSSFRKASMREREKIRTFPLTSRHIKEVEIQVHIFSFISTNITRKFLQPVPATLLHW